jgi:hypothetical protein
MVLLEVEIDSKGVVADDLVVDEGLQEGGLPVAGEFGEGEAEESLGGLEVVRGGVGDEEELVELVRSELDWEEGLVGTQFAIEVGNLHLCVALQALCAGVLVRWGSLRLLALDEEVAGARVDVETVGQPSDRQVDGEVVAHIVQSIVLLAHGFVAQVGGALVGKGSHVVVDNELAMDACEGMAALYLLVGGVVEGEDALGCSCGEEECEEQEMQRVHLDFLHDQHDYIMMQCR